MKIVPNDLLNPTEKCIKVWNCSFIATEGPNITGKISLDDLEIPYTQIYRSRITLGAGETDTLLNYGNLGEEITYLMIKVNYDSENDPYYIYTKENYYLTYSLSGSTDESRPIGRLMVLSGSDTLKIPRIYITNPNTTYGVTLDVIMANHTPTSITGITY